MEVEIIEIKTGEVACRYTINLRGLNYTPTQDEYFSEAWKCAVEDGEVDADSRDKYGFNLR